MNLECITERVETLIYGPREINTPEDNIPKFHPFKLPIEYLAEKDKHPLSSIVETDLELVISQDNANHYGKGMYDYLFKPSHDFGKKLIPRWKTHFTTNVDFLTDSQEIINHLDHYTEKTGKFDIDCDALNTIWKDTRADPNFLEKYSFMDWYIVKHFNKSVSFLQLVSIANITSPIISLFIPFIFLIFPFILLKLKGVPITTQIYIDTLKEVAKNHFIGKAITNMQTLRWDKLIYLIFTIGLYLMQIYNNVNTCYRFFRNMTKINHQLCDMSKYLEHSILSMDTFVELNRDKISYSQFFIDVVTHRDRLVALRDMLIQVTPCENNITAKILGAGYMLRCYYEIHSNQEIADSIQYSFGFEGYVNNLCGIRSNLDGRHISSTTYVTDEDTSITAEYYPSHIDQEHMVVNDCSFNKNIIITGPNASGKTTMLKTTTINIILSQQTGFGFYQSCRLNPYTHIHSYLNIPDTSGRDSLFQAESRRCKEILDIIQETVTETCDEKTRHFCIFDELYSGTNPEEASKSAYSFLLYLSKFSNVDFVLTTHYFDVCERFNKSNTVDNYKMDVITDDLGKIKYTYRLTPGISDVHGAIKILEDMEYPPEILKSIYDMDNETRRKSKSGKKKCLNKKTPPDYTVA